MPNKPLGFLRMLVAAAIVAAGLCPQPVVANSDGYYCVGQGFLAFEQGIGTSHALHVVRVAHNSGITQSPPIALEDFQVHGMTCRGTVVVIQGYTKRYSVQVSGGTTPTVTTELSPLDPSMPLAAANLGMLARPDVIDIPSDGPPSEFQLVVAQATRTLDRLIEYYTVTQVIQRDTRRHDLIIAAATLFNGLMSKGGEY